MSDHDDENSAGAGDLSALDGIAREAASVEAQEQSALEAGQGDQAQTAIDPAQAWAQIPAMVGGILAMALPEVRDAYNEKNCLQWGQAMAAVSEKYGWEAGEVMAKFGPEIALVMASVPLVLPVAAAVKVRRIEADKRKRDTPKGQPVTVTDTGPQTLANLPEPGGFVDPA